MSSKLTVTWIMEDGLYSSIKLTKEIELLSKLNTLDLPNQLMKCYSLNSSNQKTERMNLLLFL